MRYILYFFLFIEQDSISLFFFFQAEDGIRDPLVTGVQTCALPISRRPARSGSAPPCRGRWSDRRAQGRWWPPPRRATRTPRSCPAPRPAPTRNTPRGGAAASA